MNNTITKPHPHYLTPLPAPPDTVLDRLLLVGNSLQSEQATLKELIAEREEHAFRQAQLVKVHRWGDVDKAGDFIEDCAWRILICQERIRQLEGRVRELALQVADDIEMKRKGAEG